MYTSNNSTVTPANLNAATMAQLNAASGTGSRPSRDPSLNSSTRQSAPSQNVPQMITYAPANSQLNVANTIAQQQPSHSYTAPLPLITSYSQAIWDASYNPEFAHRLQLSGQANASVLTLIRAKRSYISARSVCMFSEGQSEFSIRVNRMGSHSRICIGILQPTPFRDVHVGDKKFGVAIASCNTNLWAFGRTQLHYHIGFEEGANVTVRMNFDAATLEFIINGISCGVSKYKLVGPVHAAVTLYDGGDEVVLHNVHFGMSVTAAAANAVTSNVANSELTIKHSPNIRNSQTITRQLQYQQQTNQPISEQMRDTRVAEYPTASTAVVPYAGHPMSMEALAEQLISKKKLIEQICSTVTAQSPDHRLNILLLGPVSAGKSSLINTLITAWSGEAEWEVKEGEMCAQDIMQVAVAYGSTDDEPLTNEIKHYIIPNTNITLIDTWGWTEENYPPGQLEALLDGDIPNGFSMDSPMEQSQADASQVVHAVIIVLDIRLDVPVPKRLMQLTKRICRKGYQPILALTHIDALPFHPPLTCQQALHRESQLVSNLLERIHELTLCPQMNIYPIKPYAPELGRDVAVESLAVQPLYAAVKQSLLIYAQKAVKYDQTAAHTNLVTPTPTPQPQQIFRPSTPAQLALREGDAQIPRRLSQPMISIQPLGRLTQANIDGTRSPVRITAAGTLHSHRSAAEPPNQDNNHVDAEEKEQMFVKLQGDRMANANGMMNASNDSDNHSSAYTAWNNNNHVNNQRSLAVDAM